MGYAEEIRVLKMKLNAMIEENAKLLNVPIEISP